MDEIFWLAVNDLFESILAMLGFVAPEVLLAAGEMLTAYATEACAAIGVAERRIDLIVDCSCVRGITYFQDGRRVH